MDDEVDLTRGLRRRWEVAVTGADRAERVVAALVQDPSRTAPAVLVQVWAEQDAESVVA